VSRKPVPLPDLDEDADAEFRRKLSPLLDTALPDHRKPVMPDDRNPIAPEHRINGRVEAAEEQARIEATRGAKRRFEYLIPERVGRALADDAAAQGKSATTRLLEVLRDAGYPVIQEDLVDLRKMPKR
jgi:hypothetical protein